MKILIIATSIFAFSISLGRSSLASTYSQILPIAHQCPYAGGPAVYIARAFVEMIDPTVEYFDDAVCLQSGIFREADETEGKEEKATIVIIPNPANEYVEVKINGKLEGLCRIAIVNMLGEKTVIEQMACEEQTKKINVRMLKPGIYTVKVYNNELTKTTKLVISR